MEKNLFDVKGKVVVMTGACGVLGSYTDFILTKIERVKEIENLNGGTLVSEGIDANYMDIINYSVFGVIKLTYGG